MPRRQLYDYNAHFRRELTRLNADQRTAVDRIDGPVMVLAGPGTGKTHLLAARIGNILLKTDAGAHNILCLTFTDAGVKAMRERLLSFIGPEAHRVGIHTFHSFCSNIIQHNLHYFGRPGLEPLAELERIDIVRRLLDDLPLTSPLRLGYQESYYYEDHLRDLFAQMKAENWEPDALRQKIAAYLRRLPEHEDFIYRRNSGPNRKGDPKAGAIAEETRRMEVLSAAVDLFPAYQEALRRRRRYDYGDMIGWVLRAFHDHPSLLRSYQERYQYLLIDEFQDTNGSQDRIIRYLTDYWENPNVFIVGDDDQAIYEFQGARLNAMVDFYRRYRDNVGIVTLGDNYRSPQALLDAASALIGGNRLRIGERLPELEIRKELRASGGGADAGAEPTTAALRLLRFPDRRQETAALIGQLRAWRAAGTDWAEMAVIYARHRQADYLRHVLERAGIPYRSKRRPNVLDGRPVRQLREMLRYLSLEHERPGTGEYLLFRLLHFRCFGLEPHDLSRLNLARLHRREADQRTVGWRDFLGQPNAWPADLREPERITRTAAWLERTIGLIGTLPLAELVEEVTNGSGLLTAVLRSPERAEWLQHLATFSDFVLAEVSRRPRLTVAGLIDTLEQMDGNRIALPLRSHLDQADAVLLVTAHSAKGLEFERVWLLDCSEGSWGPGSAGKRSRFRLPDTLTFAGAEDEEEARRRLFFVALTRAKTETCVSYAELDERDKPQQPVRFLDELTAAGGPVPEAPVGNPAASESLSLLQLSPKDPARFPVLERSAVTELLNDFRLSVSALYAYLDCPLRFYYEKLLRVPDRERERTVYGSALHAALQDYFLRMKRDPQRIFPSREELLFNFTDALGKRRGLLTAAGYRERLARGRRELGAYYDRYRAGWITDVEIEYAIQNVEVDGIPLTGVIDRIDLLSDAFVRVVDYKTSSAKRGKLSRPTAKNPNGGDYWRQLTFYKLLYDHRPGNLRRVKTGRISYLLVGKDGTQGEVDLTLQRRDTDALRAILRTVWEAIQEQQFGGCGKPDCEWCRFVADLTDEVPTVGTPAMHELDDRA